MRMNKIILLFIIVTNIYSVNAQLRLTGKVCDVEKKYPCNKIQLW